MKQVVKKLLMLSAILTLTSSCSWVPSADHRETDRLLHDAVANEYWEYVALDVRLTEREKERRRRTYEIWSRGVGYDWVKGKYTSEVTDGR